MEMEMKGSENGIIPESLKKLKNVYSEKLRKFPSLVWKVGHDDPRRVIHAFKVGLSLTLVSLLYLLEPLFNGIGQSAIWAVMTVVVVLEFTAGATLCKGLNRGLGTLLAGLLAFLIEYVSNASGRVLQAVFIGASVFIVGAGATYMRFFPYVKKNYDYGVVIFLLTFNLITVSSYRVDNVLKIAHERFYTIAIGCAICLFMSLLIFPNWSGEDLHSSTAFKLEGLAKSIEERKDFRAMRYSCEMTLKYPFPFILLQNPTRKQTIIGCVNEYFYGEVDAYGDMKSCEDPIYKGYKAVLDSKSTDETLALHASWEPRHSRYCHKFPWQQYVKVGIVLRQFGYTVVALHGCLRTEIQTPGTVRIMFKDPCIRLASEVSKVLIELANSIRNRRHCSPEILSDHLHEALQDLNNAIKSQPRLFLGSNNSQANNMLAIAAAQAGRDRFTVDLNALFILNFTRVQSSTPYFYPISLHLELSIMQRQKTHGKTCISSVKTDSSALFEWKMKRVSSERSKETEKKVLRPQLSKIAITSLEFSEALPFAAFASLLVETVAKLDLVIEEVEELGRLACFKEYRPGDEVVVKCEKPRVDVLENHLPSHGVE
ncbi:putative aluminum-activated malate transporter [Lupinus albus]|uniref:Putative aluminum-activated malate transporter n=1 Tax=Lupinus albus TaxID=3870 RepID=A0A6A4Q0U6_LUPAL|nr:putative aluminum-activated malate transporter [Lupinus albus]